MERRRFLKMIGKEINENIRSFKSLAGRKFKFIFQGYSDEISFSSVIVRAGLKEGTFFFVLKNKVVLLQSPDLWVLQESILCGHCGRNTGEWKLKFFSKLKLEKEE